MQTVYQVDHHLTPQKLPIVWFMVDDIRNLNTQYLYVITSPGIEPLITVQSPKVGSTWASTHCNTKADKAPYPYLHTFQ